ncbi:MAG: metal ABC transporter substrate-binding protein [Ilumatobacteraceae bacterium]
MSPPKLAGSAFAAALLVLAVGCGSETTSSPSSTPARLDVVTTVAPITSIAANVGGDRVEIHGVVPEGTNSHTFEPVPSQAKVVAEADVIFMNGLDLEDPTKALTEANEQSTTPIVELGPQTIPESEYIYDFSFPKEDGKPNPHLWTNPPMAKRYAEIIAGELSKLDPANATYYQANSDRFAAKIAELDAAMRTSFATVPKRELLTYHDAYAYFGKEYDWKIIGAIQVSDFEDPTPQEVADLIRQVRAEGVPAIFGSEVFPSPVLEQIGRETGVRYVDVLRDDDLPGAPGDPEHSWLGLMRFDFVTMTEALGGDATALRAVTVEDVAPDHADYPQ